MAPSLLYLFSLHTLPSKIFVMQILPKNPSDASRGVDCACGCQWVVSRYLCALSTLSLSLPLLIVVLKIHRQRRISNALGAGVSQGWKMFTSVVFNMVIESVSARQMSAAFLPVSCSAVYTIVCVLDVTCVPQWYSHCEGLDWL